MTSPELEKLRAQIDLVNRELLMLLSRRGELVLQIDKIKQECCLEMYDPAREAEQIALLAAANTGPYPNATIQHLFTEIFRASLAIQTGEREHTLRVSRSSRREDTVFQLGGLDIGGKPLIIAGPCAAESRELMAVSAKHLSQRGVRIMRGGAHKPRTSPYSFQGVGDIGYRWLGEAAHQYGMLCISEVMDEASVKAAAPYIDILQIGARNMSNFRLLEIVRGAGKPVLLKRGNSATYEEWLLAAEYLIVGEERIILCERGIRTFEPWTRNTLDISAVPILRQASHLPVCVDISHAAGRKDILASLARASLAAGANMLMMEVHPTPAQARCDAQQQIDFREFDALLAAVRDLLA